jgi:hypothetical protein
MIATFRTHFPDFVTSGPAHCSPLDSPPHSPDF